jgi:hypothetical protein
MASESDVSEQTDQQTGLQTARIIVPRAIVYSDELMSSPLGYVSSGKLITVGNKRKRNPELVSVVVYGRLAFIESKNIHYENELAELSNSKRGASRKHNIDILLTTPEEKLAENNSTHFSLQQFSAGEQMKNLINITDGTSKSNYTGIAITMLHRQSLSKTYWGAGFDFYTLSTPNFKSDLYLIKGLIGYTPVRTPLFLIDLSLSLDLSTSASFQIKNNSVDEPAGFLLGNQIGAAVVFFPEQKYHLIGGISYRNFKVYQEETFVDQNGVDIDGISQMSGLNLSIGFAFEI